MSSSLAVPAGLPVSASPAHPWLRRVVLANLVVQSGIVLTGGLVRLTASGLGCTTWPQCVPGSYTPVAHQAEGWHKYVEFTNRLATGLLIAVAVATVVVVIRHQRETGERSRPVFWLGLAPLLGVVAQIVVGGITVLTNLSPWMVACHFLLSMVLVSAAMALVLLVRPAQAAPVPRRAEITFLTYGLAAVATVVLLLGMVVTGSGPHSGDSIGHPSRFGFDPRTISWMHADSVWLFVGLAIALSVALRLVPAPPRARTSTDHLIAAIVLQGAIGYLQYATGLPIGIVAVHLLGTALIAAGVTGVVVEVFRSRPEPESSEAAVTA
ncbi:MAG TPA: COX15/CtaA family protein [Kineosporiaceae bacterium]|nr:COX15/CtaA family protein [Kineosporiaceae bacterium]